MSGDEKLAESISYDREKTSYLQNFEHLRHINTQLNKIPPLAVTITGGLWFAAGLKENISDEIRFGLLVFAGITNVALALISYRLLHVLNTYLDKLGEFYKPSYATIRTGTEREPPYFKKNMVFIYSSMMILACIMSFTGAFLFWPFEFSRWWGGIVFSVIVIGYTLTVVQFSKPSVKTDAGS